MNISNAYPGIRAGAPRLARLAAGLLFACLLLASSAFAKIRVDFDPTLNFSQYKTWAYIGGVNTLEFKELNPNYIRDRVHEGLQKALGQKGLTEVKPDQNPDLVIRYWANSQSQIMSGAAGTWGQFGQYVSDYWAYTYDLMTSESVLDGTLVIDLIDPHKRDLAWRLYISQHVADDDSIWGKMTGEIPKGMESYPPSPRAIQEKKKERAEHPPKPQAQ